MELEVKEIFEIDNKEYYVETKIDGQIYHMSFQLLNEHYDDTLHYNIYLYITSKRKQIASFENIITETGKSPFTSYVFCRKAFELLEETILKEEVEKRHKDVVLICNWLDNRRRDAYYRFLSKRGFHYDVRNRKKCLLKEYKYELPQ